MNEAGAYNRWIGLVGLTLGVTLIIVDSTILNVAIPSIVDDLGLSLTGAQWANSIYALVLASLLVSFGTSGDRRGRRRVFLLGVVAFLAGSVLAGMAQAPGQLLAARLVQGVGGAAMLPTSLSLVNATFRGRERAIAFAVWGSVIGGVVALGPLIGGWAISALSWRWAFFVNVPIGLCSIWMVTRNVAESRESQSRPGFDVWGTITFVIGMASLVFVAIEGRLYGWWRPGPGSLSIGGWRWPDGAAISPIPVVSAACLLAFVAFALVERSRGRRGLSMLVDFSLFRISSFRNGNIAAAVVSLGELGLVFVIPIYLQVSRGYSALETGVALLALASGAFVAGGATAPLTRAMGARAVVRAGMALEVVSILALGLTITPDVSLWLLEPALFAYGIGVGLATAQLTSLVLADVPVEQSGAGSGLQSTSRQVGSALGIAIIGSVFAMSFQSSIVADLRASGSDAADADRSARSVASNLGQSVTRPVAGGAGDSSLVLRQAVREGIPAGARDAAMVAAAFVLLGLVATIRLPADVRPIEDA